MDASRIQTLNIIRMSKRTYIWLAGITALMVLVVVLKVYGPWENEESERWMEEEGEENPIEMKRARAEYFFRMLRDPATNRIPNNIRSKELKQARTLPSRGDRFLRKSAAANSQSTDISWQMAGPKGLGGRTRALAVDQRQSDIILAGGVSGGIWKSTDGGANWQMKTSPNQNMSVTSLAQDPTAPDTWYYSSGEYLGNSASDRGYTARYYGTGIYKSTDNGESWSLLPATADKDNSFSSRFDYVSEIKVSPTTGSVFAASNAVGLLRSQDGGSSFTTVKGGVNLHVWTGFDIDSQGNIVAVLSSQNFQSGGNPGVFYSTDDGDSWTEITPTNFPSDHGRSVVRFAPSQPSTVYVFTNKLNSSTNQGVSFFKIDISDPQNPVPEDRSANLPDFGGRVGGINLQGGYNMVLSVKPDDPDFVLLGATNLFRSRDGFSSKPANGYDNSDDAQKDEYWVGGYAKVNNVSQYPNQHPDQHVIAYDPSNPDKVWSGHDGGLSLTSDITASAVNWQDQDEGYVTGQFYTVELGPDAGDQRLVGGTQDNGSPYFRIDDQNMQQTALTDLSSGDGGYAHIGQNYIYTSSQNGHLIRWNSDLSNYSFVEPLNASNQLFIHPYEVDPHDDGIVYYPGGTTMWRNTTADEITNKNKDGTTDGWDSFSAVSSSGYLISTLELTRSNPRDRLYYAAYSSGSSPKVFYLDHADTTQNVNEISIPNAPSGAYVHDLAVNPQNGDEVIAVMSNYGIVGLYHSGDGGANWTAIEGNLTGDSQNPGPSIRNATILPTQSGPLYLVGTSTGVYSTSSLSGSSTTWTRESDDGSNGSIGYSVSEYITSRPADGKIAVGTHGRGIFVGEVSTPQIGDGQVPAAPADLSLDLIDGDVMLDWQANSESDITKYYIYRGPDSDNLVKYDSVDTPADASFTDAGVSDGVHFYEVTAFDSEGNESQHSQQRAVYQATETVDNAWALVGSPMGSTSDMQTSDKTTIFGYTGVYESASDFNPQHGYWVKSQSGSSITFGGMAKTSATVSLSQGWNLIGGVADTVNVSDISDPNGIRSATPVYKYVSGSYQSADEITPTRGYWIRADEAGDIGLSTGSSSSSGKQSLAEASSISKLRFSYGRASQQFFVASQKLNEKQRARYRMPPEGPHPRLDVRTGDGLRLAEGPQTPLQLTTDGYPVHVSAGQNMSAHYVLKGVTGADTVYYDLKAGNEALIQRPHEQLLLEKAGETITEHRLLPNYPNPFNPTTQIRYRLASGTAVKLAVYDVLGRRVRTLVDKRQPRGSYTVTFDGSGLSSGVYFIHLKAGKVAKVQKMTLLK